MSSFGHLLLRTMLVWAAIVALCAVFVCVVAANDVAKPFYSGPFKDSMLWVKDHTVEKLDRNKMVKFTVALNLRNVEEMKQELLDVSMPQSAKYGQFLSLDEISQRFGPSYEDRRRVVEFFQTIDGAKVHGLDHKGDFITVTAPVYAIEERLGTKLSYRRNKQSLTTAKAVRCDEGLVIPHEIQSLISFVSLNSPITHVYPRAGSTLKSQQLDIEMGQKPTASDDESQEQVIGVTQGNTEALLSFVAYCRDGSRNVANPPCSNLESAEQPKVFTVSVTAYNNDPNNLFPLDTAPTTFAVDPTRVYCYNSVSHSACNGSDDNNCICLTKISPLPKYKQLKASVSYEVQSHSGGVLTRSLGSSSLFALTDVATASFLNDLYSIPPGLTAHPNSNQSVVEFYSEFYSNSDLLNFFALSGLPDAIIPEANVLGDLPNDESNPGGEAQLDVEYIMALAPEAPTYFYSFSDLNPNDPENEGFLAYLTYVSSEVNPPWVHSLSYGDVESVIFGTDEDSVDPTYGTRCDYEFLKLGLRGISVIFSSGDDGIGNFIVRDDPETACSKAYPAWPASSPYVTSVGATQLTDSYLPACGNPYAFSASYGSLPDYNKLLFECTGAKETVCSSTIGGVITSGGGFSDVFDRATLAPWQNNAVKTYLSHTSAVPSAAGYFNPNGRGYPDVATYGSNYFIYLAGKVTRESGTSASAPVFAAMVTLWNSLRFAHGQAPMGFIAPFLYAVHEVHPSAFQDITTGDNACGAGHSIDSVNCCSNSFAAAPGWDAVTGLGTPNFKVIANLVLNHDAIYPSIDMSNVLSSEQQQQVELNELSYATSSADSSSASEVSAIAIAGLVMATISTVLATASFYFVWFGQRKEVSYDILSNKENLLAKF